MVFTVRVQPRALKNRILSKQTIQDGIQSTDRKTWAIHSATQQVVRYTFSDFNGKEAEREREEHRYMATHRYELYK